MSPYEHYDLLLQSIGILFSFTATICSIIAIVYTYKNLKEIRDQFFEQNRGQLVFYLDYSAVEALSYLVLKNFGSSPARTLRHECRAGDALCQEADRAEDPDHHRGHEFRRAVGAGERGAGARGVDGRNLDHHGGRRHDARRARAVENACVSIPSEPLWHEPG